MVTLTKKERSTELNELKRVLIDFKSLVEEDSFIIYKNSGLIFYIFDQNGFTKIIKTSNFLKIEDFLDNDEYVDVKYSLLKQTADLKKAEVTEIFYDSDTYSVQTNIDEVVDLLLIKKKKDSDNLLKNIIYSTSQEKLLENFIEANYREKEQILVSTIDNKVYPYKITFSDDINFKLKIENPESKYYMRTLNDGAFIQVITISKYKEIYHAQTILFVFNYLNKKEV
jgi:hypothetical protein